MKKRLVKASLILFPVNLFAWGTAGHKTVAAVADRFISKTTKQSISRYLGKDSLATASTWADEIKKQSNLWSHTYGYHFEAVSDNDTYLNSLKGKDSAEQAKGGVIEAILESESALRNPMTSFAEKTRALKFLVHFVGDIHQPLHSGRPEDRGGNDIERKWNKKKTNLHAIWDTDIIESGHSEFSSKGSSISEDKYADFLIKKFANSSINVASDDVDQWTQDSMKNRPDIYKYAQDSDAVYTNRFLDVTDSYVYIAGVRLAAVLTSIMQNEPESQKQFGFAKAIEAIVGPIADIIDINPKGSAIQ